jgi:Fe-S cluster assembly ATP-binding protein
MLKIFNLSVSVMGKSILNDISLSLDTNTTTLLLGPNGCGKSTLLQVLMGSKHYEVSGSIFWHGKDITDLPIYDRALLGVFLAFQDPVSIPGLSLLQLIKQSRDILLPNEGSLDKFIEIVYAQAARLGKTPDFLHRSLNVNCSGGERKIGEWLQLIMLKPKLCLIDEIDSGLDIDTTTRVLEDLNLLVSTKLIVTHSYAEQISVDQVVILKSGRIYKQGDASLLEYIKEHGYGSIST